MRSVDISFESSLLISKDPSERFTYKTVLVMLGLMVNILYNLYNIYSLENMTYFGMKNWAGVCFIAISSMTGVAKITHSKLMLKIPHKTRAFIFSLIFVSALLLCFGAFKVVGYLGFWMLLFGGVLFGIANTLYESLVLGFAKASPPNATSLYILGSGAPGVFAVIISLSLKALGVEFASICLIALIIPLSLVLGFNWLIETTLEYRSIKNPSITLKEIENEEALKNTSLTIKSIAEVLKYTW